MYKIKEKPEDFIVEEKYGLPTLKDNFSDEFCYCYYLLEKKNYNTMSAVMTAAKRFSVQLKNVAFCGNKDKHAVTKQLISVRANKRMNDKLLDSIEIGKDTNYIKFTKLGYSNKSLYLGYHDGNKFTITVNDIDKEEYGRFNANVKKLKSHDYLILNLFGEQRFSTNNIDIGKSLIRKDFKTVVESLLQHNREFASKMETKLEKDKNDYVNILRIVPLKLLSLFVNAYQSYLWNQVAEFANSLINYKYNHDLIVFGFSTNLDDELSKLSKELEKAESNTKKKKLNVQIKIIEFYKQLVSKENVTNRDLIIRQIPQLSANGWERKLYAKVNDFSIVDLAQKAEHYSITISFSLEKSCYATTVVKELFI